jgi:hypothetical protein
MILRGVNPWKMQAWNNPPNQLEEKRIETVRDSLVYTMTLRQHIVGRMRKNIEPFHRAKTILLLESLLIPITSIRTMHFHRSTSWMLQIFRSFFLLSMCVVLNGEPIPDSGNPAYNQPVSDQPCAIVPYAELLASIAPDKNPSYGPHGFGVETSEGCILTPIMEKSFQLDYPDAFQVWHDITAMLDEDLSEGSTPIAALTQALNGTTMIARPGCGQACANPAAHQPLQCSFHCLHHNVLRHKISAYPTSFRLFLSFSNRRQVMQHALRFQLDGQ